MLMKAQDMHKQLVHPEIPVCMHYVYIYTILYTGLYNLLPEWISTARTDLLPLQVRSRVK